MLSKEFDKKYFFAKFMRIVYAISSKEYQKRVWIDAEGVEPEDFDEACIGFRRCDIILEESKSFGLTKEQIEILKKFREEFDKFSDENDWPPFFIDTPEWTRITELAKEVLVAFNHNYHEKL